MAIPLATTTITVTRSLLDATADPYDAVTATPTDVAENVRAVIGSPSGFDSQRGQSHQEDVTHRLNSDPVALQPGDMIVDDVTGDEYTVVWARTRVALGVDHTVADLRQVTGLT